MTTEAVPRDSGTRHIANEALAEILFSPEGRMDPYSRFHRLQDAVPIHQSSMGVWVLSRYDDISAALRDKHVGKDVHAFMAGRVSGDWEQHPALRKLASSMLWANPPEHTRLRKIVNRVFTKDRVLEHRKFIQRRVDELLEPLFRAGGGDICNDFCYPLPISVVAGLVGVPQDEAPRLREPIRNFQRTFELGMTASDLRLADEGASFLDDYFDKLVRHKRRHPGDDLLSALIDGPDPLDDMELAGICNMLIAAGSETATQFLNNGIRLLIEHPDQAAMLQADPALMDRAIEEVLRFDPPVHILPRTVSEPFDVDGVVIPSAARMMLLIGAANRDPARFTDPDRFDVTRDEGLSISFGAGIHGCPGWRLAKLQAEATFTTLLHRFPRLEITKPPRPQPRVTLPGVEALYVRVRQDAAVTMEAACPFLSPDYLAGLERLGQAGQSVIPHVNLSLQFHVTDAPGGAADYYMLIDKGVFTQARRGRLAAADLEIQTDLRPLADFQTGELHAATAFLTGKFAVTGDKAKLLELMVAIQAGNYHTFIADLWDRTT